MSKPVHMRKGNNYSGNSFSATYADSVIGTILAYGGTTAPYGWFLCQGQAISRTEYHELFEVIGTSFGAGDGSTTFNLPDLRGEFLRGAGTNQHANQGSGGTVGQHQDATEHVNPYVFYNGSTNGSCIFLDDAGGNGSERFLALTKKMDKVTTPAIAFGVMSDPLPVTVQSGLNNAGSFTSKPTNTSVNFIIKAKYSASPAGDVLGVQDIRDTLGETPIPSDLGTTVTGALSNIDAHNHYSSSETWTGKYDTDGKKIYVIRVSGIISSNTGELVISAPITNLYEIKTLNGITEAAGSDLSTRPIPFCYMASDSWWATLAYQAIPGQIVMQSGSDFRNFYNGKKVKITLEYTKTT